MVRISVVGIGFYPVHPVILSMYCLCVPVCSKILSLASAYIIPACPTPIPATRCT